MAKARMKALDTFASGLSTRPASMDLSGSVTEEIDGLPPLYHLPTQRLPHSPTPVSSSHDSDSHTRHPTPISTAVTTEAGRESRDLATPSGLTRRQGSCESVYSGSVVSSAASTSPSGGSVSAKAATIDVMLGRYSHLPSEEEGRRHHASRHSRTRWNSVAPKDSCHLSFSHPWQLGLGLEPCHDTSAGYPGAKERLQYPHLQAASAAAFSHRRFSEGALNYLSQEGHGYFPHTHHLVSRYHGSTRETNSPHWSPKGHRQKNGMMEEGSHQDGAINLSTVREAAGKDDLHLNGDITYSAENGHDSGLPLPLPKIPGKGTPVPALSGAAKRKNKAPQSDPAAAAVAAAMQQTQQQQNLLMVAAQQGLTPQQMQDLQQQMMNSPPSNLMHQQQQQQQGMLLQHQQKLQEQALHQINDQLQMNIMQQSQLLQASGGEKSKGSKAIQQQMQQLAVQQQQLLQQINQIHVQRQFLMTLPFGMPQGMMSAAEMQQLWKEVAAQTGLEEAAMKSLNGLTNPPVTPTSAATANGQGSHLHSPNFVTNGAIDGFNLPIAALEDQSGTMPAAAAATPSTSTPAAPTSRKSGIRPPSGYMTKSTESLEGSSAGGDAPTPSASRLPRSKETTPEGEKKSLATPKPSGLPKPASSATPAAAAPSKESKPAASPSVSPAASAEKVTAPAMPATKSPRQAPQQIGDTSLSTSIDEKLAAVQQQQENEGLQAEIKDLKEKLETLMMKRSEDKAKLKEMEKMKIQLQQLQEFKTRMQETQSDLQRQLQASKKKEEDLRQEFDQYKDEMADVSESMEMAALDKEMAEEKAESLQQELDSSKEKLEELTLELELLRGEISEKGSDGVAATFEMKQLEQQNERMKEGLVKMRDLLTTEKQERQQLDKRCDKQQTEISNLQRDKERFSSQVSELQNEVIELKEQVDAALGAEEMVEKLTERNLQLEEKIEALEEEKNDLEALNEMNEELQENARETELELREERDNALVRLSENQRRVDAMQETVADYETTLNKFRGLVAQLQEANKELRSKQLESETKAETPTIELFDFKAKFAETKAFAKTIDMELRKLEVLQASSHVKMLLSFMPDAFLSRGGDHDAVSVLLMVPRIINKAELLASQVKEKFEVVEKLEKDHVLKGAKAEQCSFANHLVLQLASLQTSMHQYESALNNCGVELFVKVGTLLPEMGAHEKTLDHYIEMLRKDQLDETVSLEMLDKSIAFFQQLYTVHLANERVDCTNLMCDAVRCVLSACDCINTDISRLKILLLAGEEQSEFSILLRDLETCNNDTRMCARKIKRRLPQEGSAIATPLKFMKEIQDLLLDCCANVTRVARSLQAVAQGAMNQASVMTDKEGLMARKMEELAYEAVNKVYTKEDSGPYECLRLSFGTVVGTMNKLANAMENGEFDFDGTHDKKTLAPVRLRAEAMRSHFGDVEVMKNKLDLKDEEIKELKKLMKIKQEELSEQQVRVSLIEKKLENANKDADDRVDKIQRKLDEANVQFKKKEKEFEETYDTLQGEIDNLEQEKTELKERLRVLSKKTLLEGLTRQSSGQAGQVPSPSGSITGSTSSLADAPHLVHQMESLKEALTFVKHENIRLKGEKMKNQLAVLPSLRLPLKPMGLSSRTGHVGLTELPDTAPGKLELNTLASKTGKLLVEANKLSACPKVVDITKRKPGSAPVTDSSSPTQQLVTRTAQLAALEKQATELQVQVTTLLAANRTGGQVRTDFSTFPTPQFAKVLYEKSGESLKVGRIRVPCTGGSGESIPINIQPDQLHTIHARFLS